MSIALDIFFVVLLTMLFAAVFSIATGVSGYGWPIYAMAFLVDVAFWQFSNNTRNYVSVADAMTLSLCCILHALVGFLGVLLVSICCIFFLGKNIHLLWFVPLVLIFRMHMNICGESLHLLCTLLLSLYVLHCNLKFELSVLMFLL